MSEGTKILNRLDEQSAIFESRFSRCHGLLHFTACRVIGNDELAEEAVRNCWHTAFPNPPGFEQEGDFRSWLLRILIDEARSILWETSSRLAVFSLENIARQ